MLGGIERVKRGVEVGGGRRAEQRENAGRRGGEDDEVWEGVKEDAQQPRARRAEAGRRAGERFEIRCWAC